MSEPFIGQIIMFGGNFAPRGWALCDGQILPISQNTALFSILGTTYGGDGRTTFALPDLRGRVPIHAGSGPGLSSYQLGEKGGVERVTLTVQELPSHSHQPRANAQDANSDDPDGAFSAVANENIYSNTSNVSMSATTNTGGSQPHENRPPYLAINYIIALVGIFPSRN